MDENRNKTIRIDPESRDIVLDEHGNMEMIYADDTTAQCVRLTLQTWITEFPLDVTHGTDYERILGKKASELEEDEAEEVLRDAILQEQDVAQVDSVAVDITGRSIEASFKGTLYSGQTISTEVTV